MISVKAVLFDLDGTLIEFHWDYLFDQTERYIEAVGHPFVERKVLQDSFAAFDYFRFVVSPERKKFIDGFWGVFDWESFPGPALLPCSLPTLESLAGRQVLSSIVTSRMMAVEELKVYLDGTRLLDSISHVQTRPGEHIHWTDKRPLIVDACRSLGCKPEDVVMVGDSPTDITSARDVGVGFSIAVMSGGIRRDVLEKVSPDLVLEDISALEESIFQPH